LFFCPKSRLKSKGWNPNIEIIKKQYPEANIYQYADDDNIEHIMRVFNYIPLLRLYTLYKHFLKFPHLKDEAIFYCDSDILFLKPLDFSPFLNDDVNYLSWTGRADRTYNYIWADYFDNKIEDVLPEKLNNYKKLDVLDEIARLCGINRQICVENRMNSGGAQYLLKNITHTFWEKCLNNCCAVRRYLHKEINPQFFSSEDKGFQSWCADMWSVLYTLWANKAKTECPVELDFAWATDEISTTGDKYILHNAGVTSDAKIRRVWDKIEVEAPAFFKGNYVDNKKTPFQDTEYLNSIINNPTSSLYCTSTYTKEILETKINLQL